MTQPRPSRGKPPPEPDLPKWVSEIDPPPVPPEPDSIKFRRLSKKPSVRPLPSDPGGDAYRPFEKAHWIPGMHKPMAALLAFVIGLIIGSLVGVGLILLLSL